MHRHIKIYWNDVDKKLMEYIDKYFEIRLGNFAEEEKVPLTKNEKGALKGYQEYFNDKNGKWLKRVINLCQEISKKYVQQGLEIPVELSEFQKSINFETNVVNRIKIPLKALYRLTYHELLNIDNPIIIYDENGNIERINLKPEQLKMAINMFALTGNMANKVAHSILNEENANLEYEYKHKMMTYTILATYDYNKISKDKINCKFSKRPSKKDGHSYPCFTIRIRDIGKISLHFGGSLRFIRYAI